MPARLTTIAKRLRYKIPRIKLCLVHEGLKADELVAINAPEDAESFLEPLRHAPEEHFVSLHLNSRNEVIGLHEISHGTLASSLVHPREVFKAALVNNSFAIVVCHNHPSGSAVSPSLDDLNTTRQLLAAGRILGVSVLDHLILTPNQCIYSIRENYPELWKN
ncbi:MAG TPA: JAB domain-containing protein [Candidatus Obscuribacterales bacterium]